MSLEMVALYWLCRMHKLHAKGGMTWQNSSESFFCQRASLLGARTLLGAPGLTTRSKKLLGTKGIATNGAWTPLLFERPGRIAWRTVLGSMCQPERKSAESSASTTQYYRCLPWREEKGQEIPGEAGASLDPCSLWIQSFQKVRISDFFSLSHSPSQSSLASELARC